MSSRWKKIPPVSLVAVFISASCYAEEAENQVFEIEPIVVTAQKVEQGSQDVPVSLSVFSEKELEKRNISDTYDLVNKTPNLSMIKSGNPSDASFLSLRGITPTMEGSQTVLFLVDGVPYLTFDTDIFDAERVEVLRGPQGTLYGKNASSGVINVITNAPEFRKEGSVGLGVGNYGELKTTLISNDAINNELAYRAAFQFDKNDGYFTRSTDGNDELDDVNNLNGRVKLRWSPLDSRWDMITTIQGQKQRNGNNSFASLSQIKSDSHKVYSDTDGYNDVDVYTGSVRVSRQGNNVDFTSTTAYTYENKDSEQDLDFTPLPEYQTVLDVISKQKRFTQEFRFNSKQDQALRWLTGIYFENEDSINDIDYYYMGYPMGDSYSDMESLNYAVFGNVSYLISDQWEFVSGLRYDRSELDFDYASGAMSAQYTNSYTKLLPKVGVNYYAGENVMVYTSVSEGYKSGSFNPLVPSGVAPAYDPEYTMNYELGMKSQWLDGRLTVNGALFWIDWKDQQVEQQQYPYSYTDNAGKTVSRGVELDVSWMATSDLKLFANGGYNDAHFDDYNVSRYDGSGNYVGDYDYSDKSPANTPGYTYTLGADYTFMNNYFVNFDYSVIGKMYFDNENTESQSDFGVFNVRAGYADSRYEASLWAKNLFDEEYVTRAFVMNDNWYGRSGDPMTMGVDFKVKW